MNAQAVGGRFPGVDLVVRRADFEAPLVLPLLDGHRRGQQPALRRARSPGRGGPAAGHAPPAGRRVRGRRVRHRPRQPVGPAPVQRGPWERLAAEAGLVETRGSGACRAGSSARSTPRAACGPRLTTARPWRERQVAAASLGPSMRSPWRPTTGSAPPRVSHRTSPSPATSHGSPAVTMTPVRSASPSSPMPGGRQVRVLGDGPGPCRRVRVRGDDQSGHDRQARHDAVRRPGEGRHRHRPRAGAGEDRASAAGGLIAARAACAGECPRDDPRVAAREVDDVGGAQTVRERRVGGRGGVEDHHRLDPDRATGTAGDALEGRDAMGCREVGPAAGRRGRDDRDPDRLAVGDERARGREQARRGTARRQARTRRHRGARPGRARSRHGSPAGHPVVGRRHVLHRRAIRPEMAARPGPTAPTAPMNRATASGAATNGAM